MKKKKIFLIVIIFTTLFLLILVYAKRQAIYRWYAWSPLLAACEKIKPGMTEEDAVRIVESIGKFQLFTNYDSQLQIKALHFHWQPDYQDPGNSYHNFLDQRIGSYRIKSGTEHLIEFSLYISDGKVVEPFPSYSTWRYPYLLIENNNGEVCCPEKQVILVGYLRDNCANLEILYKP